MGTVKGFGLFFFGLVLYSSLASGYLYETEAGIDPHESQYKNFTEQLPGEQIDRHTGEVGHYLETVNIKGNGLPIKLGHRYHWEQGYDVDLGRMSLEVPRIEFIHMGKPDYLGLVTVSYDVDIWKVVTPYKTNVQCSDLTLPSDAEYRWPHYESSPEPIPQDPNSILRSGIKIKLGYQSIDFFPKAHDPSDRFPGSAVYISPSNWYIECVTSSNVTGTNAFKAVSPDGVEYVFDIYQEAGIHGGLLSDYPSPNQDTKIYVSTITDKHGNTLNYEYDQFDEEENYMGDPGLVAGGRLLYYRSRIKAISASDGRRVNVSYSSSSDSLTVESNSSNPIKLIYSASHSGDRLKITRKDGKYWEYNYIYSYDYQVDQLGKIIEYIKYPNGLRIDYDYYPRPKSEYQQYLGGHKSVIEKRTVSGPNLTTLIEDYTYSGNTTFVKSPIESIEYKFGKIDLLDHPLNTAVTSGKLIRKSILPKGTTFSQRNSVTPLKRTNYSYSRVGKVIDLNYLKNNWSVSYGFSYETLPGEVMTSTHASFLTEATTITTTMNGYTFTTQKSNYDDWGNPETITETNTLGKTKTTRKSYNYDTDNNWIVSQLASEAIDGETAKTTINYNSKGTVKDKSINGIKEYYSYHLDGNLYQMKIYKDGALLPKITYLNYYRGIARNEIDGVGNIRSLQVYDFGKVKSETDFNGNPATTYHYDILHRLMAITPPIESATVITWPTAIKKLTTRGAYSQTIDYNALMKPILVTEKDTSRNEARYFRKRYDAAGYLTYEALPSFNSNDAIGKGYTYDALGRIQTIKHTADNSIARYCHGSTCGAGTKHGLLVTDPRGYKQVWNNLAFGNPDKKEIDEIKQQKSLSSSVYITTSIDRGKHFQIKEIVQGGVTRGFTYKSGKLLLNTKTEPETGVTQYLSYDERGKLLQKRVGASGTTVFRYDNDDKIEKIDYPGSTDDVDYVYQGKNLAFLKTGNNRTVWDYSDRDALNKINTESLSVDGLTFTISYNYDNLGNLDYMRLPRIENPSSSRIVDVTVDTLGRTRSIDGFVSNIDYFANNAVSEMFYENGYAYTATLNAKRLPLKIFTSDINQDLIDLTYFYDKTGNVTEIEDNILSNNDRSMTYDGLERLTVANGRWGSGSVNYSDTNDINSMSLGSKTLTYTYNVQQHLKQISGTLNNTYLYDVYGNIIANGTDSFVYDDASQMVSVTNKNIDYSYDGNKKRVKVQTPGKQVYYVYNNAGELLYRYDATQHKDVEYINLNGKLLAKLEQGPSVTATVIIDTDDDGLSDADELAWGTNLDNPDTDGDGISDGDEILQGRNPLVFDIPLTPTGLTATPSSSSNGKYVVSWNNTSIATSYQLIEKKGSGAWVTVHNGTAKNKNINGKASGTYYYKVRACNAGQCSSFSNQISVSVVLPPAIPSGLTVPSSNDGSVTVRWNASATATSYQVQTKRTGSWRTSYTGNSLNYNHSLWNAGGNNYFRVRACNSTGCSSYSGQVVTNTIIGGA